MTQAQRFATYPSLRDEIVIITGGASGIGASLVTCFAQQGSRVAFLDIETQAAEGLIEELSYPLHAPLFFACDLTDVSTLRRTMAEILSSVGTPKALINNAGSNLRHQFFVTQAVIPAMKENGSGSIINLSSISPVIPSTGLPGYVAAKAGIIGLTRTLSKELGEWNIRVNAIQPGAIATERQRRLWLTPEYTAEVLINQSLKRMLEPEEVARLALFLAADDSSAITGQSYIIDGGWV
jgi:NAD(P)-dependent dehydrogenase (short-subunit alcohol dehydrogenase family)